MILKTGDKVLVECGTEMWYGTIRSYNRPAISYGDPYSIVYAIRVDEVIKDPENSKLVVGDTIDVWEGFVLKIIS